MHRPVVEAVIAISLLSIMDALIKGLVARLPVVEVALLRYLVGSTVMIALASVARPGWPRPATVRANAIRAVLVVVTATTFFYGLGTLPLAEVLILSFLSPIFTAVLAVVLLGERLDRRIGMALAAGFAGVVVIVTLGGHLGGGAEAASSASMLGAAAVLLSSLTYSASNVLLRARAQQDKVVVIVLIQNLAPALMLAVPAWIYWETPASSDVPTLIAVGCLGVGGHLFLARAYAAAQATRLAPLDYTALIWAVAIGYLAFGEVPTGWAALGGVLILAGTALASRRRGEPRSEVEPEAAEAR